MKSDLDALMAERGLDAAVVTGSLAGNPTLYYMVNGAKISSGTVIKKRGEPPILIYNSIERDEAVKSGIKAIDIAHYRYLELLQAAQGRRLKATVQLMARVFHEHGISGRVAFYGRLEQGAAYVMLRTLDASLPHIRVVGEYGSDIFSVARATKEPAEVARIREAGRKTVATFDALLDFLRGHTVRDEVLCKEDGTPLTVGEAKRFIRRTLFDFDLVEEIETIFAMGRHAGVPHSHGEDQDVVRLGQPIVVDMFPRERGGGYFFDMTRTFCLGYAPDEVAAVYEDVKTCYEQVVAALAPDTPAGHYDQLACEYFEARGHPTLITQPEAQEGFIHPLGHGIGLAIHERPVLHHLAGGKDPLKAGAVFTVEPGLYYPSRGLGVRLEDVFYLDEEGVFHNLTDYPMQLVVEMG